MHYSMVNWCMHYQLVALAFEPTARNLVYIRKCDCNRLLVGRLKSCQLYAIVSTALDVTSTGLNWI